MEIKKTEIIQLEAFFMEKNKDIERLTHLNQENIKEITLIKDKNHDLEAILTKINEELLKNHNLIKQKSRIIFKKNDGFGVEIRSKRRRNS